MSVARAGTTIVRNRGDIVEQFESQGLRLTEAGWLAEAVNALEAAETPTKLFAQLHFKIDRPLISEGANILIVAEKLSCAPGAYISSGYSSPAPDGAQGRTAGSIKIIAKEIQSLKVVSKGQQGGQGGRGPDAVGRGAKGSPGPRGTPAKCSPYTQAGDGGKGGEGGKGPTGGAGLIGARGGASGAVEIRYLTSAVNLAATPNTAVDFAGGDGGHGGQGGKGGRGGEGGDPGARGQGEYCRPKHPDGDGEEIPPGDPGEWGDEGDWGDWGAWGPTGSVGDKGNFSWLKFANEVDFYNEAARHAPDTFQDPLDKAEMLYLLNRDSDARPVLEMIAPLKDAAGKPRPDAVRAMTLLTQMDVGLTYFGEPKAAASVIFKDGASGARNVPLSLEDVRKEFEGLTLAVTRSEGILNYRRRQEWDGARAEEAYRLEIDKLTSSIGEFGKQIEDFVTEIEQLQEKLRAHVRQAQELTDRIRRLFEALIELKPGAIAAFEDFCSSVTNAVGHIGTIGAAIYASNWVAVGQGFLSFLSSVSAAEAAVQRIKDATCELEAQVNKAKDDLFFIKNEMSNIETMVAKLTIRKISAQQRIGDYREMARNLELWWSSKDTAKLADLAKIAERAHRDIRNTVARSVYALLRYIDLRTGRNDGLAQQRPADGINKAFGAIHMEAILGGINNLLIHEPPTASVEIEMATFDSVQHAELFRELNKEVAMNIVVPEIAAEFANAQVSSISIIAVDESGANAAGGIAYVSNSNAQYFPAKRVRYLVKQYNVPVRIGAFDDNARIFAYQSPLTIWSVRFFRRRVKRFSLVFRLEIPASPSSPPPSRVQPPSRVVDGDRQPFSPPVPWNDIVKLAATVKT